MAEALGEIAARGGLSEIGDASQWQREQRQDRTSPGRDESSRTPHMLLDCDIIISTCIHGREA